MKVNFLSFHIIFRYSAKKMDVIIVQRTKNTKIQCIATHVHWIISTVLLVLKDTNEFSSWLLQMFMIQVNYFSRVTFCTSVVMKIIYLKKKTIFLNFKYLLTVFFSPRLENTVSILTSECNSSSSQPLFFFPKTWQEKKPAVSFVCYSQYFAEFFSGSAQTHAFQMVL